MNKRKLTGLLSVLCVLLCALVLFCACGTEGSTTETGSSEVTTTAPDPATDPETNEETDPETDTVADSKVTYTITVVDQDGNAVAGVEVQMCDVNGICLLPVVTNENGIATFEQDEAVYYVTIPSCPEGYTADSTVKHNFDEGSTEMTVTITKNEDALEA